MTLADCDAVERLRVNTWKASYADILPAALLRELQPDVDRRRAGFELRSKSDRAVALVAYDDADLVGWLEADVSRDTDDAYELYALYVAANKQGQGVGRRLVEQMRVAGAAPDTGQYREELVWTLAAQAQAIAFYQRVGYALDGQTWDRPIEIAGVTYELPLVRLSRVVGSA